MPWTGLMYNFDGTVKNCIRSSTELGNIQDHNIQDILLGETNLEHQSKILNKQQVGGCSGCYALENRTNSFGVISDRVFYIKELKDTPLDTYTTGKFDLQTVDVRWSNLCNFACVYCGPRFSSKWSSEIGLQLAQPNEQQYNTFKNYIMENAHKLKHVYLAGGEPLLMKENMELLERLSKDTVIRINTNLSKVDTPIFDKICEFKNIHWIISAETMADEYEYIRYGGSWDDFLNNLKHISNLGHDVTFNMLHFLLNYRSLFDCVDYFQSLGFHNNSFVIGALTIPDYLNIRHLPSDTLESLKCILSERIAKNPGFLLENSYRNLLAYIQQPIEKDLDNSFTKLQELDKRRGLDSRKIFKDLYNLKDNNHGN